MHNWIRIVFMLGVLYSGRVCAIGEFHDRYVGVLTHNVRNIQQLVKLDLLAHYENATLQYFATFTLYFGGYDTDEYVTYTYPAVRHNQQPGELVLANPKDDITLKIKIKSKERLEASISSSIAGPVGEAVLTPTLTPILDTRPIITPLAGRYEGVCEGRPQRLVLQTYRNPGDTNLYGNPFHALRIKGQLGAKIEKLCGPQNYCVINQILTGSYNFYELHGVNLSGSHGGIDCEVSESGDFTCLKCDYEKAPEPILTSIWPEQNPFAEGGSRMSQAFTLEADDIDDGEYVGYVFHENRGIYQPASMNFTHHKHGPGSRSSWFSLSAVMYFGTCLSSDKIPYRFNEKEVVQAPFLFQHLEHDVDAMIYVEELTKDEIRGVWYSKIFGRVGPFYLVKKNEVKIPDEATTLANIATAYTSNLLYMELHTYQKSGFVRHENPFALVGIAGFLRLQSVTATRFVVSDSSYDFYTGKMALELDSGIRVSTGRMHFDQKGIDIRWMSMAFAYIMVDDTPIHMRRVDVNDD